MVNMGESAPKGQKQSAQGIALGRMVNRGERPKVTNFSRYGQTFALLLSVMPIILGVPSDWLSMPYSPEKEEVGQGTDAVGESLYLKLAIGSKIIDSL
jgi:hypothetical protein